MEIKPKFGRYVVFASDYCRLDSDVMCGGGTDDTENIQALLDMAKVWGSLYLVMDGAALIRGIKVHSNTTIKCMNSSCGFYLADHSDCEIIRNAELSKDEIKTENITLSGGTYNHNNLNQSPDCRPDAVFPEKQMCSTITVAMRFFGVRNMVFENLTICDHKRYALLMGNFEDISFNNINIPLPHLVKMTNQDGLHFHGPGRNLRLTNIYGRGSDDFIALNADEGDGKSSITDVVIDGVVLKDASQGIRLLSYNNGSVENVSIKNVSGVIRSYGFIIQPYFEGTGGKFRNISIENVSLFQHDNLFAPLTPPAFFRFGGNVENMVVKNASIEYADGDFSVFDYTSDYCPFPEGLNTDVQQKDAPHDIVENLTIDGLSIKDSSKKHIDGKKLIQLTKTYKKLVLRNIKAISENGIDSLVDFQSANVGKLILENIELDGIDNLLTGDKPECIIEK